MATKETKPERLTVFLPPAQDNEENFKLVGVNGKMIKIMRGVPVQVEPCYKYALDDARIAHKVLDARKEAASKKAQIKKGE